MDQSVHHLRFAAEHLGAAIPPGARILDYGCGGGHSVEALVALGYDAYGVDIDDHWNTFDTVPAEIRSRLFVVAPQNCRLPFPDGHFDFCFSDQVLEHVFDYVGVFAEIGRVMKPGALSLHRFPGPNKLMESHVELPFPWLCYSRLYLTLWALCGRRNRDTRGKGWRETVAYNVYLMQHANYPTKQDLRAVARSIGASVDFLEKGEFALRGGGRFKPVFDLAARAGLRGVLFAAAAPFMSRYMLLRTG